MLNPESAAPVSGVSLRPAAVHDMKGRLSLLWLFALLNYLYADVVALFDIVGSPHLADAPHLPPMALMGSAVLMEIPIAMILASQLLPFRANRLANIIAASILTVINAGLTYIPPLFGAFTPALPGVGTFAIEDRRVGFSDLVRSNTGSDSRARWSLPQEMCVPDIDSSL